MPHRTVPVPQHTTHRLPPPPTYTPSTLTASLFFFLSRMRTCVRVRGRARVCVCLCACYALRRCYCSLLLLLLYSIFYFTPLARRLVPSFLIFFTLPFLFLPFLSKASWGLIGGVRLAWALMPLDSNYLGGRAGQGELSLVLAEVLAVAARTGRTDARVYWPCPPARLPAPPSHPSVALGRGGERELVLESKEPSRSFLCRNLKRWGLIVWCASQGGRTALCYHWCTYTHTPIILTHGNLCKCDMSCFVAIVHMCACLFLMFFFLSAFLPALE